MKEGNPFEIRNKEVWLKLKKFTQKKFTRLSKNFLKGTQKGQLKAIYRDRETNLEKLEAYKYMLSTREIVIDETLLSGHEKNRLKELGISLDDYK